MEIYSIISIQNWSDITHFRSFSLLFFLCGGSSFPPTKSNSSRQSKASTLQYRLARLRTGGRIDIIIIMNINSKLFDWIFIIERRKTKHFFFMGVICFGKLKLIVNPFILFVILIKFKKKMSRKEDPALRKL